MCRRPGQPAWTTASRRRLPAVLEVVAIAVAFAALALITRVQP